MYKKIGFYIMLSLCNLHIDSLTAKASDVNHHVIILIDRSGSIRKKIGKNVLKNLIRQDLKNVCLKDTSFVPGRKLLDRTKNDYLSIV